MQWTYQNQPVEEIPEGYIGFVYLITNLNTGQKYIGKKLAQFKRTKPPLKGKKLKRRSTVESDWREYWGSSERLLADVQALGPENFTREIIYLCKSKAERFLACTGLYQVPKNNWTSGLRDGNLCRNSTQPLSLTGR